MPIRRLFTVPHSTDPLTAVNLDDLLDALGLASGPGALLRCLLAPLLRPAAARFARSVRAFDDRVGRDGLAVGSEWMLRHMTGGLQVDGRSQVPSSGPLLVLANHPGMADTLALFAALRSRADLLVIAQDRPFLRALTNVAARHLVLVDAGPASRMRAVRAGVRHLQQGGALLSFPAGAIEPDPAAAGIQPALAALQDWPLGSFTVFARAIPQTRIVVAIVRQVVSARALRHPLTRLRRGSSAEREKLAAALQILWPPYRALPACVAFGIPAIDTAGGAPGSAAEMRLAVLDCARVLMQADLPARSPQARA